MWTDTSKKTNGIGHPKRVAMKKRPTQRRGSIGQASAKSAGRERDRKRKRREAAELTLAGLRNSVLFGGHLVLFERKAVRKKQARAVRSVYENVRRMFEDKKEAMVLPESEKAWTDGCDPRCKCLLHDTGDVLQYYIERPSSAREKKMQSSNRVKVLTDVADLPHFLDDSLDDGEQRKDEESTSVVLGLLLVQPRKGLTREATNNDVCFK
jgi:hypothetical protein